MEQQAQINYLEGDKKKGHAQEIDFLIGQRVKEIRKMQNLTQEDIAAEIGVSFQQIQKYENGKNRISFSKLYELSNYLNVPLDSFVANIEPQGMSDKGQSSIKQHAGNDSISQKETDELLKIYYSLEDPKLRKNLLTFIKSMAENLKDNS